MENLTIVKVGGAVLEDEKSFRVFLNRFHSLTGAKILVHGGGRTATLMAGKLGIENRMVEGRRVTGNEMMEVVTMVYGGLISKKAVAFLQGLDCNALGLCGADLNIILATRRSVGQTDYGLVGDVERVNTDILQLLLRQKTVPVIAPLTHDGKGQLLNTNADTIAASLASALSGLFRVSLLYCLEQNGVLMDFSDQDSVIPLINRELFDRLREEKIIHSGMLPKLENGFLALESGVQEVIITNAENPELTKGTKLIL